MHRLFRMKASVALVVLIAMLCQGTWVLAGTTGAITGQVLDASTRTGVPNAKVTVVSPSQSASSYTDSRGNFTFLSLGPDTYTLSVEKQGYDSETQTGLTVFADQNQTLTLPLRKALSTIGRVTTRAAADVVKPGQIADVYSVSAAQQAAAAALGGGGSLNQAYSGIASVPGVYVPQGQSGIYQSVYIRGGNYTDLGYEFDGVPIQRAFDQYPSTGLSTLGQQELQVYTGTNPIGSQSNGQAGFINQVIRSGTYPGFATLSAGVGGPSFYHQLKFEIGGATPNRNFSYYVGLMGYNQELRYANQFNGASLDPYYGALYGAVSQNCGTPNASAGCYANAAGTFGAIPTGPNGYTFGPFNAMSALTTSLIDRETVVNVHFGIPHHKDGGKDDIQVLYDNSYLKSVFPDSFSDWTYAQSNVANGTANYNGPLQANAGTFFPNCGNVPAAGAGTTNPCAGVVNGPLAGLTYNAPANYLDRNIYSGPVGQFLTAANLSQVSPYYFPTSPQNRPYGSSIPSYNRDAYNNSASIFKVQYQKNMGSNAYFRVYGYSFYSDWLQAGYTSTTQNFTGGVSPDYELPTHTRGAAFTFADQINAQNLINVTGGYTYSSTTRWNNQFYSSTSAPNRVAVLVNANNPTAGCYSFSAVTMATTSAYCGSSAVANYSLPGFNTTGTALHLGHATDPTLSNAGNFTCGGGPCAYYTVDSGVGGTYSTVAPRFSNLAFEDQFTPTKQLLLTLGVHYDDFRYDLTPTGSPSGPLPVPAGAGARSLYTNSFNQYFCFNPSQPTLGVNQLPNGAAGAGACATAFGPGFANTNFTTVSSATNDYHAFEPRFGATFTLNSLNVLRASYGKYLQPASSAFQQYNTAQNNVAAYDAPKFYSLGFTSPSHTVYPETSFNLDASWEHQVKGTDISWKITPFMRKTQNSIYNVLLDPKTNFVSGINIGNLTAQGLEFLFRKGDFDRNGFAAQLAYTYTWATVKYNNLPNGQTVVGNLNQQIQTYNAYTSFCASNPKDPRCGTNGVTPTDGNTGAPVVGAPCYTSSGAADPTCAAGSTANPYWNAPVRSLLDPGANYIAYNQLPGAGPGPGAGSVGSSYNVPHVFTLLLNYKKDKLAITPSFQMTAGGRYGIPNSQLGIDPGAGCAGNLAGATAGDPRYQFGAAGGSPYDAQTCAAAITTPNFATGNFDNFGAFLEPTQLVGNLAISYQVTPKLKLNLTMANLFSTCFGGTRNSAWTNLPINQSTIGCWYTSNAQTVGNFYNPGNVTQPFTNVYVPSFGNVFQQTYGAQANPFQMYLTAELKL